MFCSGCGVQLQSGLIYCSRCGRRVAEEVASSAASSTMIAAYTAGIGFIAYIFVMLVFSRAGLPPDVIFKISFLYFGALFGISFFILRQGWPPAKRKEMGIRRDAIDVPDYLSPAATAQLEEPRDAAIPTVTEVTTRSLDEVLVERK